MQFNHQSPITITDGKKALMLLPAMLPRKVEAAMAFIGMVGDHGSAGVAAMMQAGEYGQPKRKHMTDGEGRAYEAALAVVNLYFTGEMSFEDNATVVELTAAQKEDA